LFSGNGNAITILEIMLSEANNRERSTREIFKSHLAMLKIVWRLGSFYVPDFQDCERIKTGNEPPIGTDEV